MFFSFPCCLYEKRDKSGLRRKHIFILILRLPEEKQQYAAMWVGGTMDFERISRQESIRTIALLEFPFKILCIGFYNFSILKSNDCNIHSNWLSLLSLEMEEFLES